MSPARAHAAHAALALAALAALALAHALPHERRIRTVDLAQVVNRTVCPIEVVIDEDPSRLPRKIKMMKCAQNSLHWCRAEGIPEHECCAHYHGSHYMDCVEMRDTVVVFYEGRAEPSTYEVSVGCTCMIGDSTAAPDLPSGPT